MIYIFVVCMQITVFRDMVLQLILFKKEKFAIHVFIFATSF